MPISDETAAADVDAVIGTVSAASVDVIVAPGGLNESLIRYAATHADSIRKLVLLSPILRGGDILDNSQYRVVRSLLDQDVFAWSEAHARLTLGWGTADPRVHAWAGMIRASRGRDDWIRFSDYFEGTDYSDVLPHVRAETLIIHSSNRPVARRDAREAAASIPNARLVDIDPGGTLAWYEKAEIVDAIDEFLAITHADRRTTPHATAIILFADIVDSTGLTERIGDAAFRDRARVLETSLREVIAIAGGEAIEGKLLGDGVLATFPGAAEAIGAALRCAAAGDEQLLPLHLGLHAGDVIRERANVFGGAVNIASRISALSAPGEVLVTQTIRELARTSADVTFEDRGEQKLKGIGDPVRVFAVR